MRGASHSLVIRILRGSLLALPGLRVASANFRRRRQAATRSIMLADRRRVLALLAGSFATPALAQAPAMTRITAYAFSFPALEGGEIRLADHAGKPILVVNTAPP